MFVRQTGYVKQSRVGDSVKIVRKHPLFKLTCDTMGNVYSIKTGLKRKVFKTKHGYLQISVGRSSYLVHRLIADTFLKNPNNKPVINHRNGIKDDNRIKNLEWCTQKENVVHARDILGIKYSAHGKQNPNARFMESHEIILGNLMERGFSITEISKIMGFAMPTIRLHVMQITKRGKSGTARHYCSIKRDHNGAGRSDST